MIAFSGTCVSQNKPGISPYRIKYEIPDHTYTDSAGKHLLIKNNGPKSGINYTGTDGKKYIYAVFWTQIINETDHPFELNIDFPSDPFELPSSPGNQFKLLLPSDVMTIDKAPLYDYGLSVKSFLDNHTPKSYSLKRIVKSKSSSGIYVVTLSDHGVNGTLRTGFIIKGKDLFYRINDKEIQCGTVNFKSDSTALSKKLPGANQ